MLSFDWSGIGAQTLVLQWGTHRQSNRSTHATTTRTRASLYLPAGPHNVVWEGHGTVDNLSISAGPLLPVALRLKDLGWHSVFTTGHWEVVPEVNRSNGDVVRGHASVGRPATLEIGVDFETWQRHQMVFDWKVAGPSGSRFTVTSGLEAPDTWVSATGLFPQLHDGKLRWELTRDASVSTGVTYGYLDGISLTTPLYYRWAQARGMGDISSEADSDGDGVTNLLEFALGTDPSSASSHSSVESAVSAGRFTWYLPKHAEFQPTWELFRTEITTDFHSWGGSWFEFAHAGTKWRITTFTGTEPRVFSRLMILEP